jgi:hypothetical protein
MDTHEKKNEKIISGFEQFFSVVEEKLLECGYIATIKNKDKILKKSLNAISEIFQNKLTEKIEVEFRIYLESYLFLANFSYNHKTSIWESSFNFYWGHYDSDEDSSIEISLFVSSDSEISIEKISNEIISILRRHYISFFSETSFYQGNKIISAIKTAFPVELEVKKIII